MTMSFLLLTLRHRAIALVLFVGLSCLPASAENPVTSWEHGVVAADHELASQAGVEILQAGGNVVDAAVATGFALSVLRPGSAGLGGGGFMVIWDADKGEAITLDFRERAPGAATRDMFTKAQPDGTIPSSEKGGMAIGVPGQVAGLCHALKHYGTLPLAEVIAPALRYAEEGVPLDEHEVAGRRAIAKEFEADPTLQVKYRGLWREYLREGKLAVGDPFHSPQAAALRVLAAEGPAAFYTGDMARALVECVAAQGGIWQPSDLATMDVVTRKPISARFEGVQIVSMPPPSSGGVALVETLNILAAFEATTLKGPLSGLGHNTPEYLQLLTESLKHAFADRGTFLGDADFHDVPVERLTSTAYAQSIAARIRLDQTQPPSAYGSAVTPDDAGTTHYAVMDAAGNAVACTETINTAFGSWVVEPEYGIVLNNEMDDFTARPGEPNVFGLMQSESNTVGPRHKPLSSMTPTIMVRDGKAMLALGASGGPRIISTTIQVLLNSWRFDMLPEAAVAAPRMHHQWSPDVLYLESELAQSPVKDALKAKGHQITRRDNLAACQVVAMKAGRLYGKSDDRKHGRAAGH